MFIKSKLSCVRYVYCRFFYCRIRHNCVTFYKENFMDIVVSYNVNTCILDVKVQRQEFFV